MRNTQKSTTPNDNALWKLSSCASPSSLTMLLLGSLLLLWQPSAYAQKLSKADAAKSAQSLTQGKVLTVSTKKTNSKIDYRVKVLLPEGRVRYITVDGDSGAAHIPQGN